ncbi:hypothetical protein [Alicyclobacillus sp. SO9]|uniref:hypothetical protein n=1 Tax=Alicyclobacillus sp. SO9 TaxID=2665646 RepID=UPI0018E82C61|nr:hypothetical protein [Alicyclobacillus sp. SO9]QQE81533.1 hypothetical protein GI364_24855 [Alicyclobacillus sp. SO9]
MGVFSQKVVGVERIIYQRVRGMCEEVYYLEKGDYPERWELDEMTEKAIAKILDEYVRQHFEESTRVAAQMFIERN